MEVGEDGVCLRVDHRRDLGVELLARAPPRHRLRAGDAAEPVRHLDELRELRQAGGQRDLPAAQFARPAPAVPLLVGRAECHENVARHPQLLAQRPGSLGVVLDHPIHLPVSRDDEIETDAKPVERGVAGTEPAQAGDHATDAAEFVVVLVRLHGDVVAKPLCLLVCVRVAADIDEKRRVVDGGARLLVEPDALCDAERDEALTQYVLHGLAEAKVDAERQCAHQFGEPHTVSPVPLRPHQEQPTG